MDPTILALLAAIVTGLLTRWISDQRVKALQKQLDETRCELEAKIDELRAEVVVLDARLYKIKRLCAKFGATIEDIEGAEKAAAKEVKP